MNPLLLDALSCRNESRPPIWLMRQAGRYMPAYRAIRQQYSFLEMCHEPDLIAKITRLPIDAFGMDAAILFSDILVIPEALGVGLHFEDKVGPVIHRPLHSVKDAENLQAQPDVSKLSFVYEGIKRVKADLKTVPLLGFCGAPFTIASYMIEGKSSRDLRKTKKWMFSEPESFHRLLTLIADWSVAYLEEQIKAGVDAIQIFDSWANFLAYPQFEEFSLFYLRYIVERLKKYAVPIILFCRGSSVFAPQLATIKPHAISLDWNCNLAHIRSQVSYPVALQGNLDPDVLIAPLPVIEKEVERILTQMKGDKGFIFNLGHGIFPEVPEEAVKTVVECIKRSAECLATSSS